MTSVLADHIILTPTQPVGSGRLQRESNKPNKEKEELKGIGRRLDNEFTSTFTFIKVKKNIEIFVKTLKDIFIIPSSKLSRTVES